MTRRAPPRVALAGPMGAGKSTVGALLARRLGLPFVDLDAEVGDPEEIFGREGEAGFRAREHEGLRRVVTQPDASAGRVLALGGGTLLRADNRALLAGWRVLVLSVGEEAQAARIRAGRRPLGGQAATLTRARRTLYLSAGPVVATDGIAPEAVAAALEALLVEPTTLPVTVEGATYPVTLAPSLEGLGEAMTSTFGRAGRCVLVSNEVVAPLHAEGATRALTHAGWEVSQVLVQDGEEHKDAANWLACVNALLDARVDRKTPVLALGGGVTGDLVGFAAASVLRGVPFVQVPTTLLAMVDASVGGKTGVNTPHGKNLLGAFWQPRLVYAAASTLQTLPDDELRCGLGEVVKHALLSGEEALARCERLAPALLARDAAALSTVVGDSVRCKADIVMADPRESGVRATLNLGHTLGHAVEAVLGYGAIRHGEAVALGLVAMLRYARGQGWMEDAQLPERVEALLRALHLPVAPPHDLDVDALVAAAGFDKKRKGGMIDMVIPVRAGVVELRSLPLVHLRGLAQALGG